MLLSNWLSALSRRKLSKHSRRDNKSLGRVTTVEALEDRTLLTTPFADIVDVAPDPRNNAAGVVTINFTDMADGAGADVDVSGVDLSDFSLTLNGGNQAIAGVPFVMVNANTYTIDLTGVSDAQGTWVLTLTSAGSGITANDNGDPITADALDTWMTDKTRPTVEILGTPTNGFTNAAIGLVTVNFNEDVTTAPAVGVDAGDFVLSRNGNTQIAITAGMIAMIDVSTYTIDLSTLTGMTGDYALSVRTDGGPTMASPIRDVAGNTILPNAALDAANTVAGAKTAADTTVSLTDASGFPVNVPFQVIFDSEGGTTGPVTRSVDVIAGNSLTLSAAFGVAMAMGEDVTLVNAFGDLETWTNETTAPNVDILDVATPRMTNAGVVTVQFTEEVTGVNIADFTLGRDATGGTTFTPVDISGATVTEIPFDDDWTIDLTAFTAAEGNYRLTITSAGSGIVDQAGNALADPGTDHVIEFLVDTTAPTGDIVDVTPDPKSGNAGVVTVNFSEAVANVAVGDFTLTRDAGDGMGPQAVAIVGFATINPMSYTLDLTAETAMSGTYVLTLDKSANDNIADLAGNLLVGDATDTFVIDNSGPTADIVDVTPNPRKTNGGVVTVTFSEDVTGVDLTDFALARIPGGNVPLDGIPFASIDARNYTLDLSGITGVDGAYTLTLTTAGSMIVDLQGNGLAGGTDDMGMAAANATDKWSIDNVAPTVTLAQPATPRTTPVGNLAINFNELVTGVDIADLTLTRDPDGAGALPAEAVDISGLAVTAISQSQYQINLSSVSALSGTYVLTLTAATSGITDLATNALAADGMVTWVTDSDAPVADIVNVSPDPRNTNGGLVVTVNFDDNVTGLAGDAGNDHFTLTVDTGGGMGAQAVDITGVTITQVSPSRYTLDIGASAMFMAAPITNLEGTYVLTFDASLNDVMDASNNVATQDATDTWVMEQQAPTADIVDVDPDPRTTSAGVVTINFNENVIGVNLGDFVLTRDGGNVDISGAAFAQITPAQYTIDLSGVTNASGTYVLTLDADLDASTPRDFAGNLLAGDATDTWVTNDTTPPTADIVDVTPDPRNTDAGVVTINFSEDVTGVDIMDLSLTLDDVAVDISALSVTAVSGTQYTVDLTSVTAAEGTYVLTLTAANDIQDAAMNGLAGDVADSFVVDTTSPTADIVDVTPDPTTTNAGVVTINFSEPVTGVDITDFALTLDPDGNGANPVDISGATLTAVSASEYTLDLTATTAAVGNYVLTVSVNDIADLAGNALSGDATDNFAVEVEMPEAPVIDPIADMTIGLNTDNVNIIANATDANGDNVTFTATMVTRAYRARVAYNLALDGSGSSFSNFLKLGEKWLRSNGANGWHYITPGGELYEWNGATTGTTGTLVDTLTSLEWSRTARLYNAQPTVTGGSILVAGNQIAVATPNGFSGRLYITVTATDDSAGMLSSEETFVIQKGPHSVVYGLSTGLAIFDPSGGTYFENANGGGEKWVRGGENAFNGFKNPWILVMPNDDLIVWDGQAGSVTGNFLSNVPGAFADPGILVNAKFDLRSAVDEQLSLNFTGSFSQNYGGQNEKWIQGTDLQWYNIRPSGALWQWDGTPGSATGTVIAQFTPAVWRVPSRLYDAFTPPAPELDEVFGDIGSIL